MYDNAAPRHRVTQPLKLTTAAVMLLCSLASTSAWAAFNSGSTGADGALAPTGTGTVEIQVPESGILNYTSINIPNGITLKFKRNTLNTPVYLLVSGDVNIAGTVDLRGTDSPHTGALGNGNLADDGLPGVGGPGGFDGGRGGRNDAAQAASVIRGGSGLGPGGGRGAVEGVDGCTGSRYYKYIGLGAAHATGGTDGWWRHHCSVIGPDQAKAYGSALLQPLVGGSGGGGGRGGTTYTASGGGGGGGALLLAASGTITIASTGVVTATGGDSGASTGTGSGGQGGGGSGGALRLIATRIQGTGGLYAQGGCTTDPATLARRYSCLNSDFSGYGGANGRIRLEAESFGFTGAAIPTQSADQPGPIFLASVPALRIASVAGVAVPASPTGTADVVLPTNVANPVTVNLETTNVPTGNTVLVKLVPAYGSPTEVLSPAIAGTAAAGTASVQVTLPQGPSVLQATTTYTVVVAMGDALSRFANNERVEKVQLIATLGDKGASQARLITVSGKTFVVPTSVLQMVGFTG